MNSPMRKRCTPGRLRIASYVGTAEHEARRECVSARLREECEEAKRQAAEEDCRLVGESEDASDDGGSLRMDPLVWCETCMLIVGSGEFTTLLEWQYAQGGRFPLELIKVFKVRWHRILNC
jgi:hypothetical protein